METKVELSFTVGEVNFIKSALIQKYRTLLHYINERTKEAMEEKTKKQTRQEKDIENYKEANKILQETLGIYEQKEKEIQDIEIDQFQAELRDMIAKHTPAKRGRPLGSKNKEKVNAE